MLRKPAAVVVVLWLLAGAARAADHGDGPILWDPTQDLLEGPPYAAAPVEMDAVLQPPDPVRVVGRMLWTLVRAEDAASGDALGIQGTAVDNGDRFAEPGDTVVMDVKFVAGNPPDDTYPESSRYDWALRVDPGASGVEAELGALEVDDGSGAGLSSFEVSVPVVYRDGASSALLGSALLRYRFTVQPGQGLDFNAVSATPPDDNHEFHVQFELDQTAAGALSSAALDPGEPLFSLTQTSEALPLSVPLLSQPAVVLLTWLLLGGAWWLLRVAPRRRA